MEVKELILRAEPGTIVDNFNDMSIWISQQVAPFLGTEVSIGSLASAKKSLADLRKLFDVFETKRKAVKSDYMKRYNDFESLYKTAVGELTGAIEEIAGKVKAIEAEIDEQKMLDIEELIDERLAKEPEATEAYLRTMRSLRNPSWKNKSYTMAKIATELDAYIVDVYKAIAILDDKSEFAPQVLAMYAEGKGLADCLSRRKSLLAEKARYDALRAEQERQEAQEEPTRPSVRQESPAVAEPVQAPVMEVGPDTPCGIATPASVNIAIAIPGAALDDEPGNPRLTLSWTIYAPVKVQKIIKNLFDMNPELGSMTRIKEAK